MAGLLVSRWLQGLIFYGREEHGALAALNSVAALEYRHARDGISFTFSTCTFSPGHQQGKQVSNLTALLNAYFSRMLIISMLM